MSDSAVQKLFEEDKLLVRAMDNPMLVRRNRNLAYDFSIWAEEVELMKKGCFTSVSTTLLVKGEKVPTYKNIGFIINGKKTEAFHFSESDSGSSGNISNGDFHANRTDICSLEELTQRIRAKHSGVMNEVNLNIRTVDAVEGLFVNLAKSELPKAYILMAQEYFKMQTGRKLQIYTYDIEKGALEEYNPSKGEIEDLMTRLKNNKKLHSSEVGYWLDEDEEGIYKDYFLAQDERRQFDEKTLAFMKAQTKVR